MSRNCVDCQREMRSHSSKPDGRPAHHGHGLCDACFKKDAKLGQPLTFNADHARSALEYWLRRRSHLRTGERDYFGAQELASH